VTPDPLPGIEQRPALVRLLNDRGQVLAPPPAPALADLAAGPTVPAAARGGGGFATVRARGEPLRLLTVPVVKGGRFLGALQVASSLAPVERTLGHVGRLFGTGALAALLLSLAAGMFLARRSLAPVAAITRAARAIGAGNLSRRLCLPDHGD